MKLLILTQKVDVNDPILGFFHRWIEEFSKKFERITVICLQKGEYNFPDNVKVFSLGKEESNFQFSIFQPEADPTRADNFQSISNFKIFKKLRYLSHFYKYIWQERKNYDTVFIHMNQEYVLLGGIFWKLFWKKIYMWRNHHSGSFLTDIASAFCEKVFCTSKYSYTAKYKKTVLMPVGVDLEKFKIQNSKFKIKGSILFLGRIAPSKNIHIFVEALGLLKKQCIEFTANIYGDALPADTPYLKGLKKSAQELDLLDNLKFYKGPTYPATKIYNSHEIFVNLSSSGMYDKTIFEAMACGCLTLVSNDNLKEQIDDRLVISDRKAEEVSTRLFLILSLPKEEKQKIISDNIKFAEKHSLKRLVNELIDNMK